MRFTHATPAVSIALSCLVSASAMAAGPLTSGRVVGGTISGPAFSETWTFNGSQGDRVLFSAPPIAVALNTRMVLRDPGSQIVAATDLDRMEAVLPFSGTFTLVVEDVGFDNTGNYNLGFVNLTAGPLTSPTDPEGGVITSAEPRVATANVRGDFDVFTFTATAGDRVLIGGASSAIGATVSLYPPGGGDALATTMSRVDRQLTATGTYQVVVEDQNFDQTGSYTVTMIDLTTGPLNPPGDADGGLVVSGENKTGGLQTIGDFDVFTFNGSAGQRVLIGGVQSTGSLNTRVSVYPPGGGDPLASSTADRVDVQLTLTGTYLVVIEDAGLLATGTYRLGLLNVTSGPLTAAGDPHGGPISSGQVGTGSIESRADFDAFTFFGNAGDRVVVGAIRTTGINVEAYVYPPNGGPAEAFTSAAPRMEFVLAATGTHTIVIQDRDLALTGGYTFSVLDLTTGPFRSTSETDSTSILSAEYKVSQINTPTDLDVFRFSASAGDRIILNVIPTFTTGFATQFYLYPPGGGPALVVTPDRLAMDLATTGTYTLLIEDVGLDKSGTYVASLLNVTQGPLSTPTDPDGGSIASAEIASGSIQAAGDFDAFTFSGSAGQQVVIVGVAIGGTLSPMLSLYPPTGASPVIVTSLHRFDVQLPEDGTYTLVMENLGPSGNGAYHVSILNLATGPFGTPQDPEGGSIASAEVKTGVSHDPADLDVFTFAGAAGDRVVIAAAPATDDIYDPQFRLYPPGGGSAEGLSLDRLDQRLEVSGIYQIVIEDQGLDSPGNYSLSLMNLTSGPLTTMSDPDGGPIGSAQTRAGQMHSRDDLDAFTFTGSAGDRVAIGAVSTTGEPFHTIVRIYPPAGGEAEAYSSDRLDVTLGATGTYTILVEDLGFDAIGSYRVSLLNVTAGPLADVGEDEGGAIASAESRTGTIDSVGDMDAYTFMGSNGQHVVCRGASTSGTLNTRLYLYPPGGGAALVATDEDRFVAPLVGSGTFTIVVEDSGLDALGDYSLSFVNLSTGPFATVDDPEGGPIVSGQVIAGAMQTAADFDVFAFSANAGERVVIGGVATGAPGMNPQISLYSPSGGSPLTFTSGHRLDQQLPTSGLYALIIEDQGLDQVGSYGLSLLNLTAGPLTSPTDPDGGQVGPGESRDAEIAPLPDLDGYWFVAAAGVPVDLSAVTTHGSLNTNLSVYPPNGGTFLFSTANDQFTFWPPVTGRFCLLVEDLGLDDAGAYHMTLDGTGIVDVPGDPSFDRTRVVMMAPTPNPSPRSTTLAFTLPEGRRVQLRLYDVTGALVRTLADGPLEAGPHSYAWDGTTERGASVRSGIYYAELTAGREVQRRKLVRIR